MYCLAHIWYLAGGAGFKDKVSEYAQEHIVRSTTYCYSYLKSGSCLGVRHLFLTPHGRSIFANMWLTMLGYPTARMRR